MTSYSARFQMCNRIRNSRYVLSDDQYIHRCTIQKSKKYSTQLSTKVCTGTNRYTLVYDLKSMYFKPKVCKFPLDYVPFPWSMYLFQQVCTCMYQVHT